MLRTKMHSLEAPHRNGKKKLRGLAIDGSVNACGSI
jgi:hypothetical protein